MKVGHNFGSASGRACDDCHVVGYRFPAKGGFEPGRGESFIVELAGDDVLTTAIAPWYTALWRSDRGNVFVAEASGTIIHTATGADAPLDEKPIAFHPFGIWGLNDELVYTWGVLGDQPHFARWDGRVWSELPAPSVRINQLHGARADLLFAVGDDGFIAWWDGSRWHETSAPERCSLSDVFVADEDEVYACSWDHHSLLQGSVYGWTEILKVECPIASVAKWRGEVWVGALGDRGLSKLQAGQLVTVDKGLLVMSFDPRERLLLTTLDYVVDTEDGTEFTQSEVEAFREAAAVFDPTFE